MSDKVALLLDREDLIRQRDDALKERDAAIRDRDEARRWARYYRGRFWDDVTIEVILEPDPEWLDD